MNSTMMHDKELILYNTTKSPISDKLLSRQINLHREFQAYESLSQKTSQCLRNRTVARVVSVYIGTEIEPWTSCMLSKDPSTSFYVQPPLHILLKAIERNANPIFCFGNVNIGAPVKIWHDQSHLT